MCYEIFLICFKSFWLSSMFLCHFATCVPVCYSDTYMNSVPQARLECLLPLLKVNCLVPSFRDSYIILEEEKKKINNLEILNDILNKRETDSLLL